MDAEKLLEKRLDELGIKGVEREWLEGWIKGVALTIARGPKEESPEETRKEYEEILRLFTEKLEDLVKYPKRWKERLKRALML